MRKITVKRTGYDPQLGRDNPKDPTLETGYVFDCKKKCCPCLGCQTKCCQCNKSKAGTR